MLALARGWETHLMLVTEALPTPVFSTDRPAGRCANTQLH